MKRSVLATVRYEIRSAKIPSAFDGFRIAVISDLHNCSIGEQNHLLLEEMEAGHPDCILLTGDMITQEKAGSGVHCDRAEELINRLGRIAPVYYGMGNHEQRWKEQELPGRKPFESYTDFLESCGVTMLANRSVRLRRGEAEIRVTGLALPNRFYNKKKIVRLDASQIESLTGAADPEVYQILLAHTPQFAKAYADWGADLALAGHYHGGVIRIPGLGGLISTNFRLFPKYDYGRYEQDGREMIVTSGLGCHTIPIRWNNPPELVYLDLMGELHGSGI